MIRRRQLESVRKAVNRQAAVALIGPRQVGKTTLALKLADEVPSLYLDLESAEDRRKLADPALYRDRSVDVKTLNERHAAIEGELTRLLERWNDLEART